MKSIKNKFTILITSIISTLAIVMTLCSSLISNYVCKKDASVMLIETALSQINKIDGELASVELAVSSIGEFSLRELSLDVINNQSLLKNYFFSVENVCYSIASKTPGAYAFYFRANPELSKDTVTGCFYVKDDDSFRQETITDLKDYPEDDINHVGWYYLPLKSREAIWLDPYYNANIDYNLISYVKPIFYLNELNEEFFIGVVGIDIDFNYILKTASEVELYNSGSGAIASTKNQVLYTLGENNKFIENKVTDYLLSTISNYDNLEELHEYKNNGTTFFISYGKLKNGMTFIVYAPKGEVFTSRNMIIISSITISSIILLIAIPFSIIFSRKLLRPITELKLAANEYINGNWDFEIQSKSKDEIGELATNIEWMAKNTKSYIKKIKNLANTDSLTKLYNKNAYVEEISKIESTNIIEYGVCVCDVNNLKQVNDLYGHEVGDNLIIEAARIISATFKNSKCFRIGGDEFTAILYGDDIENYKDLIRAFNYRIKNSKLSNFSNIDVSISIGIAFPENKEDIYQNVFNKADALMYEDKQNKKNKTK